MSDSRVERCDECRLRKLPAFAAIDAEQLRFIQDHKVGEQMLHAGGTILPEGGTADRMYTLLEGWAFRFKTLPDGRRQILSILMPGDLVGLQAKLFGEAPHGVEAMTDVVLCMFSRDRTWDFFRTYPELAFDLTWLAAHEERLLDDALLTVGRRSAMESVAWLIAHLHERATWLGLVKDGAMPFPVTQVHMADTLGISVVHTNRTLQALRRRRLFSLGGGVLEIRNRDALRQLARITDPITERRPLL